MPILPGTPVVFAITLITTDNFKPLAGQPVQLRQYVPEVGTFAPIGSGVTDALGSVAIAYTLPSIEGKYRYESFFGGSDAFKPDTSPAVEVEVKAG